MARMDVAGIFAEVSDFGCNVEDSAMNHSYQFALSKGRLLEMQSAQDSI